MKLFRTTPPRTPAEEPAPEAPTELLRDGVLLSSWFIAHELDKEMERARRHHRPLTVVVLRAEQPQLTNRQTNAAINGAAKTAMAISRTTDLIGWLPECGIFVVMPETDRQQATAAAYRWREEMYTRGWHIDAPRWELEQIIDPLEFADADALLSALATVSRQRRAG
jgi:hypothetical protein